MQWLTDGTQTFPLLVGNNVITIELCGRVIAVVGISIVDDTVAKLQRVGAVISKLQRLRIHSIRSSGIEERRIY